MKNTKKKPRPNLGQIAYEEIKSMILNGELEPGERLVLDHLSDHLNLSITPIRDALNKLEQEDLVIITPRTSHSVVKIDKKDAEDIIELRLTLELFALQSAGDQLSDFPVQKFRDLFSSPAVNSSPKRFAKADADFHQSILAASQNKRISRLYSYLQNLIQVLSTQASKVEGRIEEANKEHLEMLDAIESQDMTLITSTLQNHFQNMKYALVQVISE